MMIHNTVPFSITPFNTQRLLYDVMCTFSNIYLLLIYKQLFICNDPNMLTY